MKDIKQIKASLTTSISEGIDGFAAQIASQKMVYNLIVSWGGDWEHVSVSIIGENRCPTWDEMCFIKNLIWKTDETVLQYHPPENQYVNDHPYVLHLWKPQKFTIHLPPKIFV